MDPEEDLEWIREDRKGPVGTEHDRTGLGLDRIRHDDHVG